MKNASHSPDSFVVMVDGFPVSIGPAEYWELRAMIIDQGNALVDLMQFYDRVRGAAGHGEGWTAVDVLRLEQIRFLADCLEFDQGKGHSRQPEAPGGPKAPGKPAKSRRARQTRQNGS